MMMNSLVPRSISIMLAVGLGCKIVSYHHQALVLADSTVGAQSSSANRLVERCCQIGRERAIESQAFNCKMSAREALASLGRAVGLSAETLINRDQNLADQCEMVLESCCLAHHRNRNCDSGKQFARSGSACMDVELSKEVTIATESFNDCCMSCSLGILAARNPSQNNSTTNQSVNERCTLISPLASSLSGQLYEQTYIECCQENLPKISGALIDSDAPIDCSQATNVCSQRCLARGSLDPVTRRPIEQDRCDCFSGFRLGQDGISCVDIDECKQNLHTCNRQSEICDNTHGSFRCLAQTSHSHHQTNSRHQLQPSARSLSLEEQPPVSLLEQPAPFASLRLCPLGSRWSSIENRCQQTSANTPANINTERQQQQQQHWNRHSTFTSSSRRISSSRIET
uniref:Fibulin-1 n=1 Tax=Aceria tosichella TaxID=561515 RepID=A0A6G1SFB0_9ACAR